MRPSGMARVPYPDLAALSGTTQEYFAKLGDSPLNLFRMLAGGEGLLRAFNRLGGHLLYKSSLDPKLRELAIIRVGLLSGATYEVFQHDRVGAEVGLTADQIEGLREGAEHPAFGELEAAVLRFTDDVVANVRASDATFEPLRAALSLQELQELTMTVGFYMMVSRFLETFGIETETGPATGLGPASPGR